MLEITPEEFDDLVSLALDSVPPKLLALLDNVVVLTAAESPRPGPQLYGLYEGVPLTSRGANPAGTIPDRITIFRGPIVRSCFTYSEVVNQVRITVIHELAHHFGIDDARLHELGWG